MDDDALFADPRWEAFGLLRETYLALTSRIDADVTRHAGLEPGMADLVFRLARTPGHVLRAVDIANALSTSTSRTTRLVDEAERLQLVRRRPHPTDRRAVTVELTDAGLQQARIAGRAALDSAQRHLHDRLTTRQTRALESALRALRDAPPADDES